MSETDPTGAPRPAQPPCPRDDQPHPTTPLPVQQPTQPTPPAPPAPPAGPHWAYQPAFPPPPYPPLHPAHAYGDPHRARRRKRVAIAAGGALAAVAAMGIGGGIGFAVGHQQGETGVSADRGTATYPGGGGSDSQTAPWGDQQAPSDPRGGRPGDGSLGSASQSDATDEQEVGVVLIDTTLTGGAGAGTGFVVDADGTVVTNYHVVDGSTSISVTLASTGETYDATVVGHNETADIAVLSLDGASGLTPVELDTDGVDVGEKVTTIGNSEGQGYLSAASGEVLGLDQDITTADQLTGGGDDLTGLIENDVYAVSGDSGGPLVDEDGEVVGVTVATTTGGLTRSYAVPIDDAMQIVDQVESGVETSSTRIGPNAYLGVSVSTQASGSGATIADVESGGPAARAGLTAGSVVTSVDGETVSSVDDLTGAIGDHEPGDSVQITWTDTSGQSRTATVSLDASPIA
ncbi:trypsin-like peptidase domain-containing protein [Nocardioides sp. GY 10113]|uniref:S1C family serine protease n=1 Tax=Nocardioides sp. GY 10113 TaxID=2569761 RepID=UPI001457FA68|nr:trypsin-like peptidase domain-containing protein [Nocardioides sp. GY 10113]